MGLAIIIIIIISIIIVVVVVGVAVAVVVHPRWCCWCGLLLLLRGMLSLHLFALGKRAT